MSREFFDVKSETPKRSQIAHVKSCDEFCKALLNKKICTRKNIDVVKNMLTISVRKLFSTKNHKIKLKELKIT